MNLKEKFESAIRSAQHNVDICDVLVEIAKEFAVDVIDSMDLNITVPTDVIVDNFIGGVAADEQSEEFLKAELEEEIEANLKDGVLGKEEEEQEEE